MSEYDDNSVLQVVDGISMSFYLSQDDFLKDAQAMFETLENEIEVPMRTVYYNYNSEGDSIVVGANDTPLIDEWTFKIIGTGEQSSCVDKLVIKDKQARDYIVAFNETEDFHLNIPHTLETIAEVTGCEAIYKLYVKDPTG
jgi:hypothetical protein